MTMFRRLVVVGVLGGLGLVGLSACSGQEIGSSGITEADAYKIGCPAIDSALATGSVANKAAIATLKGVRDHGNLSAEATQWVNAGVDLLQSADPKRTPKEARSLIIEGCAGHGHPLQNLKK